MSLLSEEVVSTSLVLGFLLEFDLNSLFYKVSEVETLSKEKGIQN